MIPYLYTYGTALTSALARLRAFDLTVAAQLAYSFKAANLAVCFLGFSVHSGKEFCRRSADLGVLASIFDLVSDGLKFDKNALEVYQRIVAATVEQDVAKIISDLMSRKQSSTLGVYGLDRGVDALRIVIKHLRAESDWLSDQQICDVGILCQTVDDILDSERDIRCGELNFLRYAGTEVYIDKLLKWDFELQFRRSVYPAFLFWAINIAKARAERLLPKLAAIAAAHRNSPSKLRAVLDNAAPQA